MSAPLWPLVLYSILVVGLIAGLVALSHVLGERHAEPAKGEPFESGVVIVGSARLRFSAKYYLVAMFFVIFDVEALFLYAWAVAVREAGWAGFVEALVFILVLLAALVYLWRLGGLDWGPQRRNRRTRVASDTAHSDAMVAD